MAKRSRKTQKVRTKLQEFVIVTFAEDWEQAKDYESLLRNNHITTIIKEQTEKSANGKIAVMVPEDLLDEAHVVIESQDAYDDFYDFSLEDEDNDIDFDSDFFDDEF